MVSSSLVLRIIIRKTKVAPKRKTQSSGVVFSCENSCGNNHGRHFREILKGFCLSLTFVILLAPDRFGTFCRNMFPHVELEFSNLDPKEFYCLYLRMPYLSCHRYRFSNEGWILAGCEEKVRSEGVYLHPDSPNTGELWMKDMVTFSKVKITNCAYHTSDNNQPIMLSTMHKYRPEVVMVKSRNPADYQLGNFFKTFSFNETEFIAVTAYQNPAIKTLKIENNKFAKGFRDTAKRRRNQAAGTSEDHEEEEYLVVDDDVAEPSNKLVDAVIPEPVIKASNTPKRTRYEDHSETSRVPVPLISNSSFNSEYYNSSLEAFETARYWSIRSYITTPIPAPTVPCFMSTDLYRFCSNPRSGLTCPFHSFVPSVIVHPPVKIDTTPSQTDKKPVMQVKKKKYVQGLKILVLTQFYR